MKKTAFVFWFVFLVCVALGMSVCFGIAVFKACSLEKELRSSLIKIELEKQEGKIKDQQITLLSQKVRKLSAQSKSAKNYEVLTYKLQSGDTLYNLFGPGWVKIAKLNKIECINNLQAGKTINFQGYVRRVKKGDSFSKLFGKDWKRIAYLNGFCPQQAEILAVGQKLKVPTI